MYKRLTVKFLRRWLALAAVGLSSTFAGCRDACEGVNCAPCTLENNDVLVRLDTDTLQNGFRAAELQAAYIVRYKRPGFTQPRDTVRRQATAYPSNGFNYYGVSLGQLRWPRTGAAIVAVDTLLAHNYRVVLPAVARQYSLSNLELSSAIGTGSCCNCPANVRRRLLLNGQPVVADGSGDKAEVVLRR